MAFSPAASSRPRPPVDSHPTLDAGHVETPAQQKPQIDTSHADAATGGFRLRHVTLVLALLLVSFLPTAPAESLGWTREGSPGGGFVQGLGGSAAVLVASTLHHGAYRSFDGGLLWEPIPSFPPVTEARVAFDPRDPLVGYVYGFGGVARTQDGGHTWTHVVENVVSHRLAIGPEGGLAASTRDAAGYQRVLYSGDGGASWLDLGLPEDRWSSMYGLAFGRSEDEVVAMSFSKMWVTHDAGASWVESRHESRDLQRAPDGTLWRAGWTLERSVDGGASWALAPAPDAASPIAAGSDGALFVPTATGVLMTQDAGATWENLGHGELAWGATQLLVDPADASALLIADEFVGITRISPSGVEGRTTGLPPVEVLALGASRDGSALLAGARTGAYVSRDGGASWRHTGVGAGMLATTSVAASHDGAGLLAGGQNRVFQPFIAASADGGTTWRTVPLNIGGDGFVAGLAFAGESTRVAYAAVTMTLTWSSVVRTTDGGRSWDEILSIPEPIRDVAWDDAEGVLLVATGKGVLEHRAGAWALRGATLNTWTVAAEAGRSWSNGPGPSLWGAGAGIHRPVADTGAFLVDISAEPGGAAVWAADTAGHVSRCTPGAPLGACERAELPGEARAVLVRPDGGRVFVATRAAGILSAPLS